MNENDLLDEFEVVNKKSEKIRPAVVKFWLLFMILYNAVGAISYLTIGDFFLTSSQYNIPSHFVWVIGSTYLIKIMGVFFILNWKKIGFYCVLLSVFILYFLNKYLGFRLYRILIFGFVEIVIFYVLLQVRGNQKQGIWELLD